MQTLFANALSGPDWAYGGLAWIGALAEDGSFDVI
jgi:hypothetical protein